MRLKKRKVRACFVLLRNLPELPCIFSANVPERLPHSSLTRTAEPNYGSAFETHRLLSPPDEDWALVPLKHDIVLFWSLLGLFVYRFKVQIVGDTCF